ncbi:MAG TPA: hypothetical protein VLA34_00400, partial [Candidatus Krumholzibacterium sp.]|nr:hypothetical protein [Candidatus Krumholzibacterium sp.]
MAVILAFSCLGPAALVAQATVFAAGSDNTILMLQEGAWVSMEDLLTTRPTTEDLNAVWACPDGEVFIGGDAGVMMHFDGSDWETMETGTTEDFTVIWGVCDSLIVAATSAGSVYHYEGTSWALAFSAPVGINEIFGFSSSDIYACGSDSHIFHYDGSAWSTTLAGGSLSIDFDIILPWTPDDIDIFGEYVPGDWELATCWGFHFDGASWTWTEYPQFAAFGFLWVWDGTRIDSTTMMISGEFPFRYEKDGTITMISCMEGNGINTFLAEDKWVSPSGDVYCVGQNEIALLLESDPWCDVSTYGGDESLHSVHGTSDSDIWAAGGGGTVVHYDGISWEAQFAPFEACDYTAVWGSGPSDFWFAGCMDKVLRYDGDRFYTTNVSIPDQLRRVVDVDGTSSGNVCLAVRASGAGGIYSQVEVFNGTSFTTLPALSFEIFNRVGAHPLGPVLAAVERWDNVNKWFKEHLYRYSGSWSDISYDLDYAQD